MTFSFNTKDRLCWLENIALLSNQYETMSGSLSLDFPGLNVKDIGPEHISPLACLVEFLDMRHVKVAINRNCPVGDFLFSSIKLSDYWRGHENYSRADTENILNLWRINQSEIEIHPRRIEDFFKSRFQRKDLSAVSLSLTETYYNVQDHSNCQGNAFSMINYDDESKFLNISVCDFGDGIPTTVRRVIPELDDCGALRKAMEDNFSIRSSTHNAGKGLGNIKSLCCEKNSYLWIVSNGAILVANAEQERVMRSLRFFPGTWVFYRIPLNLLPNEDIVEDFSW